MSAPLHQLLDYRPPADAGLDVCYEDEALLVINKPGGLLSVPGRGPLMADCLVSRVQLRYPDALIVHRLDLPTSGLIVLARGPETQRRMSTLFQDRLVDKTYTAVVAGTLASDAGEVNLPLITDWPQRPRQKVDLSAGKPALTRWRVLERRADAAEAEAWGEHLATTRVALTPVTGRSHQLRVHMMSLGHPIVGDPMYASEAVRAQASRLLLHASHLCFAHPLSGQTVQVESVAPF